MRWPLVSVLETEACPAAVGCARRQARWVLAEWGLPDGLITDAETVTSELISNAVQATVSADPAEPVALRLLANRERLVIEAWDCHPGVPVQREASDEEESGRGLVIVAALAHRWGTRRLSAHVKAVWAELPLPARETRTQEKGRAR
jgi:anti-sigma regulatory factor (Ser/Thr protein kinase)